MSEDEVAGLEEESRSCSPPVEDCDVGLVKAVAVDISTQTVPTGKATRLWGRVQNVLHGQKVNQGKIWLCMGTGSVVTAVYCVTCNFSLFKYIYIL